MPHRLAFPLCSLIGAGTGTLDPNNYTVMDTNKLTEMQALDVLVSFARNYMEDVYGDDEEYPDNAQYKLELEEAIAMGERAIEEEGAFDNDICPSAPRPLVEGQTAHKWDIEMGQATATCSECGATKD